MKLRTVTTILALAVVGLFVALNWPAFLTETALSLGVVQVRAPLGLVMLALSGAISGLFLVFIVLQQASVIVETRRWEKELRSQRELTDQAEASRFSALRDFLSEELGRLRAERATQTAALLARIDEAELRSRDRIDEAARSVAAHLGEIEDKLDRVMRHE